MTKKTSRSITLSSNIINEINDLCEHKKAFSSKAEELIKLGLQSYRNGARIEIKEVFCVGGNIIETLNHKESESSPPKFKSKFLKG